MPSIKMLTLLPPKPRIEIPSLYALPETFLFETDTPIVLSSISPRSLTILVSRSSSDIESTLPTTSSKGTGYFEDITTTSCTSSSANIWFKDITNPKIKTLINLILFIFCLFLDENGNDYHLL